MFRIIGQPINMIYIGKAKNLVKEDEDWHHVVRIVGFGLRCDLYKWCIQMQLLPKYML